MINLDTHILVLAVTGGLRKRENDLLAGDSWGISDIVLWELAMLHQRGRIDFDLSSPTIATVLDAIHIFSITAEIAQLSTELDFNGDPVDELIAATSVVNRVPLVTRDRVIRKSILVPLA